MKTSFLLVGCLLVTLGSCAYRQVDDWSGNNFFNGWNFFTGGDPTHGYVHYVSQGDAKSLNYTFVSGNVVYIKSDDTKVATAPGRGSVRISTNKAYNNGLFIIDLKHMPSGCGNWPAIWTVGPNWPNSGEIDIIEGINQNNHNQMTLHSNQGCTMPSNWNQQGHTLTTDCNCANGANGNAGCGVQDTDTSSFGAQFNSNGGGVFAMQWEKTGVYIWFWRRGTVPANINSPDPTSWGTPKASFPFTGTGPGSCTANHFVNHNLVIDNTFCGDWAGKVWGGCPSTCQAYVQNTPSAFKEAYWAINYIRVFEQ